MAHCHITRYARRRALMNGLGRSEGAGSTDS